MNFLFSGFNKPQQLFSQTKNRIYTYIIHVFSAEVFSLKSFRKGAFSRNEMRLASKQGGSLEFNRNLLIRCLEFPFYGLSNRKNSSASKVHKSAHVHPSTCTSFMTFQRGNLQPEMQMEFRRRKANTHIRVLCNGERGWRINFMDIF